jgi:hypothetical protein
MCGWLLVRVVIVWRDGGGSLFADFALDFFCVAKQQATSGFQDLRSATAESTNPKSAARHPKWVYSYASIDARKM